MLSNSKYQSQKKLINRGCIHYIGSRQLRMLSCCA